MPKFGPGDKISYNQKEQGIVKINGPVYEVEDGTTLLIDVVDNGVKNDDGTYKVCPASLSPSNSTGGRKSRRKNKGRKSRKSRKNRRKSKRRHH
jgi:hypothetical protein